MRSAISLLAALGLAACATTPAPGPVRSDGLARLGETTRVGGLVVTPRRVVEDSRCPVNARCVWAGRLVLAADVEARGRREQRNLMLGETVAMLGTTLALTSAEPGRMAGAEAPAPPLTFGFESGR